MNDDNGSVATTTATTTTVSRADSIRTGGRDAPPLRAPRIPLGAELPLFCERCGYSLNALPQVRCDHCAVLQFHCPECGHHQPINTLRPAMQRTLGRLRAFSVGAIAFVKLNWFGWNLFFWVIMGYAWAYTYNWRTSAMEPLWPTFESVVMFTIYGTVIGFFSRLMLLRWRSGALIGVVIGALFCLALVCGFQWRLSNQVLYSRGGGSGAVFQPDPIMTAGRSIMTVLTFTVMVLSAWAAWPVWVGFVRVVMPERAGGALLEWQRSLADPTPKTRLSDQV